MCFPSQFLGHMVSLLSSFLIDCHGETHKEKKAAKGKGPKNSQEPRKSERPCWVEKASPSQTPGGCHLSCEPCAVLCLPEWSSHLGEVIWIPRRSAYRLSFSLPGLVQLWISTWFTWELCGIFFAWGRCDHDGNGSDDHFWIMLCLLHWVRLGDIPPMCIE